MRGYMWVIKVAASWENDWKNVSVWARVWVWGIWMAAGKVNDLWVRMDGVGVHIWVIAIHSTYMCLC